MDLKNIFYYHFLAAFWGVILEVICAQLNGLEMELKLQTSEGLEVLNGAFSTKKILLLAVEHFLVSQQKNC